MILLIKQKLGHSDPKLNCYPRARELIIAVFTFWTLENA